LRVLRPDGGRNQERRHNHRKPGERSQGECDDAT
jgi:hypothetical protein